MKTFRIFGLRGENFVMLAHEKESFNVSEEECPFMRLRPYNMSIAVFGDFEKRKEFMELLALSITSSGDTFEQEPVLNCEDITQFCQILVTDFGKLSPPNHIALIIASYNTAEEECNLVSIDHLGNMREVSYTCFGRHSQSMFGFLRSTWKPAANQQECYSFLQTVGNKMCETGYFHHSFRVTIINKDGVQPITIFYPYCDHSKGKEQLELIKTNPRNFLNNN